MRHWFRSRETVAGARKGRAEILHWTLISVLNGKFWISWECLFEFFWFVYMIFFGCDDEKNQHVRLSARLVGYLNMGTTKCEHTNPFLLNQNVGNFRRWTNFWNPIKQMPNFFLAHPHLGRANYGSQRIKPWINLWKRLIPSEWNWGWASIVLGKKIHLWSNTTNGTTAAWISNQI